MSISRRQLAVILFGWALFAWLNGTLLYFGIIAEGATPQWTYAQFVVRQGGRWVPWALLTPLVVLLARRVPPAWRGRPLATHIGASITAAAIHAASAVISDMVIAPRPFTGSFLEVWWGMLTFYAPIDLVIYWATVGVVVAIESHRRLRERELLLAQAQLANLRLQIQPHFLFNTLHTIASLVRDGNAPAAVTMIAGLSDLLRYSLDNAGRNVVPLSEELEVVRRYLEIQQTRFSDRLQVHVDAGADTLDAAVPTLLLQPLVENAVRHGDASAVSVRSRRDGDTLVIEIANDGAPLPRDWRQREGVGLSSTRRRLEPFRGTLELENATPGVVARVRVPYVRELE
ncbi:MAG TPA: histidine kinase [Thermoanaerobaculia bacterium]|nr:histidine kinase [Thermoanaerobaculia bacterium]